MDYLKSALAFILNFTTGLGFYGIGLLGVALALTFFFGWGSIPAGFIGAFVYKNYDAIVAYVKDAINK
jgi:cytochrome c biogenesis protein CcdA